MFAYEKGLIWGNDNYRTNGALVNVALATGNIGRPGGGCVRMGGHQEGYSRPSDAHVGNLQRMSTSLLIDGQGGVHHIWACDHYKTTLNALKFKQAYKKRTDMVKDAMSAVPYGDRDGTGQCNRGGHQEGRTVRGRCRHCADTRSVEACHVWLPAATSGEMQSHLDERRAAHAAHRDATWTRPAMLCRTASSRRASQTTWNVFTGPGKTDLATNSRASTGRPKKTPSWTAITATRRAANS